MKIKLLLPALFVVVIANAQQPINHFFGQLNTGQGWNDDLDQRTYFVVDSATPLDHSPSGANTSWVFDDLFQIAITSYSNQAPTADQLAVFPGTEIVTTASDDSGSSNAYFSTDGATAYVGASASGVEFSYLDNAVIGTFPMSFGDSHSDETSGTFTSPEFSGTFEGVINSEVDAHGTISIAMDGSPWYQTSATRLKTVQEVVLSVPFFPNVGTISTTTYSYYAPGYSFPIMVASVSSTVVPILGINESSELTEVAIPAILSTPNFESSKLIAYPNPAIDVLRLQSVSNQPMDITVTDLNGRELSHHSNTTEIPVSSLASGVYLARIKTPSGELVKKFIKK